MVVSNSRNACNKYQMKRLCILIAILLYWTYSNAADAIKPIQSNYLVFSNAEFSVSYPTNWVVKTDEISKLLRVGAPSGDANVQIQVLYTTDSLENSVASAKASFLQIQFKLTRDEKYTFNKLPAHLFEGTLPPSSGVTAQVVNILAYTKKKTYLIALTAASDKLWLYQPDMAKITSSIILR